MNFFYKMKFLILVRVPLVVLHFFFFLISFLANIFLNWFRGRRCCLYRTRSRIKVRSASCESTRQKWKDYLDDAWTERIFGFCVFVKGYYLRTSRNERLIAGGQRRQRNNSTKSVFVLRDQSEFRPQPSIGIWNFVQFVNRFLSPFLSLQTVLVAFAVMALVSAVPVDETVVGEVYGQSDSINPQDQTEIFLKLKKLKKLLFG